MIHKQDVRNDRKKGLQNIDEVIQGIQGIRDILIGGDMQRQKLIQNIIECMQGINLKKGMRLDKALLNEFTIVKNYFRKIEEHITYKSGWNNHKFIILCERQKA